MVVAERQGSVKKGKDEKNSAARPGRSHTSLTTKGEGLEGQQKSWAGVGDHLHEKQRGSALY